MKNIIIILLIFGVGYSAWSYTKAGPIADDLSLMYNSAFRDLDASWNPADDELREMQNCLEGFFYKNKYGDKGSELGLALCRKFSEVTAKRLDFEAELRQVRQREYTTMKGTRRPTSERRFRYSDKDRNVNRLGDGYGAGATTEEQMRQREMERKKQLYGRRTKERWSEYASRQRIKIDRALAKLRELERTERKQN